MVDFRKHMTPEQREAADRDHAYIEKERKRHRGMTRAELVQQAQHCIDNSEGPRKYPETIPVYDNVVWHFVLPELIRRLTSTVTSNASDIETLQAQLVALGHEGRYVTEGGNHDSLIYINPPIDEQGYPDTTNYSLTAAIDTSCAPNGEATGRFIAALLNVAPELLRLAAIGEDTKRKLGEARIHILIERRSNLRFRAARLKHGPRGMGGAGSCDAKCEKCDVEQQLKDLEQQLKEGCSCAGGDAGHDVNCKLRKESL